MRLFKERVKDDVVRRSDGNLVRENIIEGQSLCRTLLCEKQTVNLGSFLSGGCTITKLTALPVLLLVYLESASIAATVQIEETDGASDAILTVSAIGLITHSSILTWLIPYCIQLTLTLR